MDGVNFEDVGAKEAEKRVITICGELGIAVLGILDHKHHQEGDDRGPGVDDQLPAVVEMKNWAADGPTDDRSDRE